MASLLPSRLDFHVWTSKPAQLMKVKKTMTQVAKQGEERAKKQGIDEKTRYRRGVSQHVHPPKFMLLIMTIDIKIHH